MEGWGISVNLSDIWGGTDVETQNLASLPNILYSVCKDCSQTPISHTKKSQNNFEKIIRR